MFVLSVFLSSLHAQSPSLGPALRLEPRSNAWDLVVDSISSTGALFLHRAADLPSLAANPTLMFQTNTPLTNTLRLSALPAGDTSDQAYFSVAHWPGRTIQEFGLPEDYPDIPPPTMVLFTSGAPAPLTDGQIFTVDFFIADPTGLLLDLSGPVAIRILSESDGAFHPDATVSPPTSQLTNGHMRLEITLHSDTPLDGHTLGLGPASSPMSLFAEWDWFGLAPSPQPIDGFLKSAFNLGPAPLTTPTRESLIQTLEQRRTANADAGPSWSYPLAGSGHPVSGTFGEWRGKNNTIAHHGLDLAAVAASTVVSSRGGVVSHRGTLADMGDYLVVDHGGGWFSRYLHLDSAHLSVRVGQAMSRGATLATRLYAVGNWPQHLHFEVRHGVNQSQWDVGQPGIAQDPLQTPDIFAVPPGGTSPEMREFGLTRKHLGQNAFVKTPPTLDTPGPLYLFAKLIDWEAGRQLGLRAMRFQPEGLAVPIEIRPQDDTAIGTLLPSAATAQKGFARYGGLHAATPDPANYYRYWWMWDTSSYANDRKGPRAMLLTGEDHAANTAEFRFTFGPQIKGEIITPLSASQYKFTIVAHLGTNTPAELARIDPALFVQPDQYKLELVPASGPPIALVPDTGRMEGVYTRKFSTHLDEAVYTFTLPGGTSPEGLKLRVSSRLESDIGHEVCFCAWPNLVYIPAGSFTMGSPPTELARWAAEGPQTRVAISQGFWVGKYEVTQSEYQTVMASNPSIFKGGDLPVENVSWDDAVAYCVALTVRERTAGRLPAGYAYRLPTEAEWEYACRAGTTTPFHYGDALRSGMANFDGRSEYPPCGDSTFFCYNPGGTYLGQTTPVGSYTPNAWGVYDMHGNVWEWCQDWMDGTLPGGEVTDPKGPETGSDRMVRGGSWLIYAGNCRSASRISPPPSDGNWNRGFRVVLALAQSDSQLTIDSHPQSTEVLLGGTASFTVDAVFDQHITYQWYFNGVAVAGETTSCLTIDNVTESHLGQYFVRLISGGQTIDSQIAVLSIGSATPPHGMVWIPAGSFTMGSPASEPARWAAEGPQTRVTISQAFWIGRYEVTQSEYQAVMGSNPSYFKGGNLPVETVSWLEAVAYCAALTARERGAGRLAAGYAYRLPTEAQWEYACRAGKTTPFHYGDALHSGMANFDGRFEYPPCGDSTFFCHNPDGAYLGQTSSVGSYTPNAWGVYDMHGNVGEFCQDYWGESLPGGDVTDPKGPEVDSLRVIRGGTWGDHANDCRSTRRANIDPSESDRGLGFRVVYTPEHT